MTSGIALRMLSLGALGLGALALSGCLYVHGHAPDGVVVVERDRYPGPPDHAPAHGYRRNHGYHYTHSHKRPAPSTQVELRWDDGLGVHVVVGYEGIFFHADHYYRYADAGWQWTARWDGDWVAAPDQGVPTGLRKLHGAKGKKKSKHAKRKEKHGPPAMQHP